MDDSISRQAAIDALNDGAELLRRVLDDVDVVGNEREKFEWGLGLIESCIDDIKDLPSSEPDIIRCKDCKWKQGPECVRFAEVRPFPDDFCSRAERRE